MPDYTFLLAVILCAATLVHGTPVRRQLTTGYAPLVLQACPATPLVRPADGVGAAEAAFVSNRYAIASEALASWLATTVEGTCNSSPSTKKRSSKRDGGCSPVEVAPAKVAGPSCRGSGCADGWSAPSGVEKSARSSTSSTGGTGQATSPSVWAKYPTGSSSSTTTSATSTSGSASAAGSSTTVTSSSYRSSGSSTASTSGLSTLVAPISTSATSSSSLTTSTSASTALSSSTATSTSPPVSSTNASTSSTSSPTTLSSSLTTTTSVSTSLTSSLALLAITTTASSSLTTTTSVSTSSTSSSTILTSTTTSSSSLTTITSASSPSTSSSTTSTSTSTSCTPESFQPTKYPLVGLTTSGGGYRSLLTGAGVIQGFDIRDSQTGVSGVFQGLTYQAGLSGGAWLLSSFAANNWPTITSLKTGLWEQAFQDSLLVPGNLLAAGPDYVQITADVAAKQAAGFHTTLTDPYGRLLSYQLLYGPDGGVADTDSGLATLSNFTSYNIPYPIITSLGVQFEQGECTPPPNGTQYEIHPYEFGSWDTGVAAFTQTHYLGTTLANGAPATPLSCVTNYDNQGFILGTSSNLFNEACAAVPAINATAPSGSADIFLALEEDLTVLLDTIHTTTFADEYAQYPNPFQAYPPSTLVSAQETLYLVDGGEALQNNPIWPFLHRPLVDVLIVNDNSADTSANYPNGSETYTTYQRAQDAGLTRMPVIPDVATFLADGLNLRPTFFGCRDPAVLTIIYLPNQDYTFASGTSTAQLEYPAAETDAMVANGVQIAARGGDAGWPLCLACGIMAKSGGTMPGGCAACLDEYCFD